MGPSNTRRTLDSQDLRTMNLSRSKQYFNYVRPASYASSPDQGSQDPKTTIFEDVCTMLPDLDVPVILRWEATRILDKMHKKPHDEDEWRRT